jgi:uncharacterized repeat protein (TIGR03803 family)
LVRDSAGNLYGTTFEGGILGNCDSELGGGTVYKVEPSGKTTALHAFNNGTDGCDPTSTLAIDSAGNLYGTAINNVFKIDSAGNFTTLFGFPNQADGNEPQGTLFRDSQGNLYGTTSLGGNNGCQLNLGCGTVFKLDTNGNETVLYAFTGGADGAGPVAGVIRDAAGNLYGTTVNGGDLACQNGCGVVFKIDTTAKQTILHTFTGGVDGQWPTTPLVSDSAGNLYGTAAIGGDAHNDGIVFKLGNLGNERVLHRFNNIEGSQPSAGVILDAKGNLYGTTLYGGSVGEGIVFKLAP